MTDSNDHVWLANGFVDGVCVERIVHQDRTDAIHDLAVCMNEDSADDPEAWEHIADEEYRYESDTCTLVVERHRVYSGS